MAQDTSDGQDDTDRQIERQSGKDGRIERRSFLHLAGAASVAGGSVLSSGLGDAAAEHYGISFQTVHNAVDDLGMDPDGNQAIDGALSSAAGDDTLVVFPPGTYRITQQLTLRDVSNFGILGDGDRNDVVFVTDQGKTLQWIVSVGGRNHLYANFTMDQTDDRQTGISNVWKLADGLKIIDVEMAGWTPLIKYGGGASMRPHITTRDGVGVLKNYVHTGGGVAELYPQRQQPIWMGPNHRGEMRIVDAHIENSGEHSMYASRTNGCIRVEGGLFKNNDNTHIRISSGHPDKLSWVRGAEIVIDTDNATRLPDGERYQNTRGIRVESGFQGWSGLLIEDCDIIQKSTPNSQALIQVVDNHGAVTIRNTRLHNEVDGEPFIVAQKPDYSNVDSPYHVVLDNVSITGSAANTDSAVVINGRNGSTIKDSCIQREHGNGIKIANSNNCRVANTNVNVPGEATIFRNSQVSTSGITHGDACPAPTFDGVEGNVDPLEPPTTEPRTDLDHVLDVSGGGAGNVVDYSFEVDGELEGVDLNAEDSVEGTAGSGAVAGGTDTFGFSGSITNFSASGDLTVRVDGQVVDHTQWMDEVPTDGGLDRLVSLVGEGSRADYEFTVGGNLEKSTDGGASINDEDTVDGSTATGAVWGGTDSYRFDGEITAFSLDGTATVLVDGETVDPGSLGGAGGGSDGGDDSDGSTGDLPHTLDVSGGGAGNVVDYSITVDGEMAGVELNDEDSASGATAEGAVAGGTDTYAFSGSITDVSTSGDVTVRVDGEAIDLRQWTLPNTFVVDGTGEDGTTEYVFEATGDVVEDAAVGPLEDDVIEAGSVRGSVTGDVDAFRFSGDLTKLLLKGTASVDFEDNDG